MAAEYPGEQGLKAVFTSGSTDAHVPLSRGFPAIVLGMTTGGGVHALHEYIDIAAVQKGVEQLVGFGKRALNGSRAAD